MKLSMIPLARREMLRSARRYDRETPGLGDRFLDEVRAGLLAILEYPNAHPPLSAPYRRKLLHAFPYALIYRVEAGEIAGFKRRPGYWTRRTKAQE